MLTLLRSVAATLLLSGCGYNTMQAGDEQVKAAWAEVVNQYQRRADLMPNLVETVKGFAAQEQEVLLGVTNARAKVGLDPGHARARQRSRRRSPSSSRRRASCRRALSRLLVVAENYPQLKSDANFRDLQAQLEGTENRITVARNRYIKAVQEYNVTVRQFPTNLTAMIFGYKAKPQFTVENEKAITKPPKVDFGKLAGRHDRRAHVRSRRALPRGRAAVSACALQAAAEVAVPPLKARVTDQTGTLDRRAARGARGEARGLRDAQGQPGRGADRAHHPARGDRAVRDPRGRRSGSSAARAWTTACSCSSPRTTASCASRSGAASRA